MRLASKGRILYKHRTKALWTDDMRICLFFIFIFSDFIAADYPGNSNKIGNTRLREQMEHLRGLKMDREDRNLS